MYLTSVCIFKCKNGVLLTLIRDSAKATSIIPPTSKVNDSDLTCTHHAGIIRRNCHKTFHPIASAPPTPPLLFALSIELQLPTSKHVSRQDK